MPDFPRYQSKDQINQQQPSFHAVDDPSAQIISKVGEVGKQIQDIAIKQIQAIDSIAKTASKADRDAGFLEIKTAAENDIPLDLDTLNKNEQAQLANLEKIAKESNKGFATELGKASNVADIAYDLQVAKIQIKNTYQKKRIDFGQAKAIQSLESVARAGGVNLEANIDNILADPVSIGVFNQTDAVKLKQQYMKKGKLNTFLYDINSDLATAKENLANNAYGFSQEELKTAKGILSTETERQRKELIETNNLAESDITTGIISDDPNIYIKLESAANDPNNPTSEIFVNIVKDSMNQKFSKHGKFDDKTMEKLLVKYSNVSNTKELMEFRKAVYIQKPMLDEEKFKTLLSWTTPENEKIAVDKRGWIKKSYDWIMSKFKGSDKKGQKLFDLTNDALNEEKYVDGKIYHKAGRSFKAVKNPDGSIGFEEV